MNLEEVARFAASGMLNSLLAGFLVAAIAWLAARWLDRFGAGARFVVWLIALFSIVFLIGGGVPSSTSRGVSPSPSAGTVTLPAQAAWYLFAIWLAGAVFGLLRVGYSLFRLRRLRATCEQVEASRLNPHVRQILHDACPHRAVSLCESDAMRVPAALGYFRPIVVFPKWALAELPPSDVSAILRHELAHLRRYDDWTNLAQKIVKAVLFFHPAVWFVESRLSLEREMACDDVVLAANVAPRAYAESLVNLAEHSFLRRRVQLAQAAIGHVHQLKLRVIKILSSGTGEQVTLKLGKFAAATLSLAALVTVAGVAHVPHLIGFADRSAQTADVAMPPAGPSLAVTPTPLDVSYLRPEATSSVSARVHIRTKRYDRFRIAAAQIARRRVSDPQPIEKLVLTSETYPSEILMPVVLVVQGRTLRPDGVLVWHLVVLHVSPEQQAILIGGVPHQI